MLRPIALTVCWVLGVAASQVAMIADAAGKPSTCYGWISLICCILAAAMLACRWHIIRDDR